MAHKSKPAEACHRPAGSEGISTRVHIVGRASPVRNHAISVRRHPDRPDRLLVRIDDYPEFPIKPTQLRVCHRFLRVAYQQLRHKVHDESELFVELYRDIAWLQRCWSGVVATALIEGGVK